MPPEESTPPAGTTPADQGQTPPEGQAQGTAPTEGNEQGKGGKAAVLADLAKERDERQALQRRVEEQETTFKAFIESVGKALGIKTEGETPDPARLQTELTTAQQTARDNQVLLGVYAAAHTLQADPTKIMDSVRVRESLKGVDPTDTAKITEVITAAVNENPHFRLQSVGAGAGDAGAGGEGARPPAASMNDWLRAAARSR